MNTVVLFLILQSCKPHLSSDSFEESISVVAERQQESTVHILPISFCMLLILIFNYILLGLVISKSACIVYKAKTLGYSSSSVVKVPL